MSSELARVIADAVEEARLAPALKPQAERVQSRERADAAAMAQLSAFVERRNLQPRIGARVARGPHDAADAGAAHVDRRRRAIDHERSGPLAPLVPGSAAVDHCVGIDAIEGA